MSVFLFFCFFLFFMRIVYAHLCLASGHVRPHLLRIFMHTLMHIVIQHLHAIVLPIFVRLSSHTSVRIYLYVSVM